MVQALYTHHHYGWRRHELPDSNEQSLLTALMRTHDFLAEYEGQYRVDIKATPDCSHDGRVAVYWDSDTPKTLAFGWPLQRGDYWFKAFEFNVARADGCRYCGGTGIDHYVGPFLHCWACDGTATQIRESTGRGFKHKPTAICSAKTHREYAEWLAERCEPFAPGTLSPATDASPSASLAPASVGASSSALTTDRADMGFEP
jgi:hypothetical protein